MEKMNPNIENEDVKNRLLDAAETLFCEKGFGRTSVRELTTAAGCNLAAINYYFGGKDSLYMEVWRRLLKKMSDNRRDRLKTVIVKHGGNPPLEDILRAFVDSFLGSFIQDGRFGQLAKLLAREMIDYNLPASVLIDEAINPTMEEMSEVMKKACPGMDESKVFYILLSIVGQLTHLVRVKAMFDGAKDDRMMKLDMPQAIDHIVKFSAAGVRSYIKE